MANEHPGSSLTNLRSEIKSEPIWCNKRASLVSLSKLFSQREVQHMSSCVIVHGNSPPLLQGKRVKKWYQLLVPTVKIQINCCHASRQVVVLWGKKPTTKECAVAENVHTFFEGLQKF